MITDSRFLPTSLDNIDLLVLTLVVVICMIIWLPAAAADQRKGPQTGKMSWELFQETKAGQRNRALEEDVQTLSALLTTDEPPTDKQLDILTGRGYSVSASYGRLIIVTAPADYYIHKRKGIHNLPFIQNATLPPEPLTGEKESYQPITSGTSTVGASRLWAKGYRGQGMDIAVIDMGFNPENVKLDKLGPSYYLVRPTGNHPGEYYVREGAVSTGDPGHGTACGIIAGDVAPGADLHLISFSKGTSVVGWLQSLDYALHDLGAEVVSTSLSFPRPFCHGDGTGLLNRYVDHLLSGDSTPLILSAGNWAGGSPTRKTFYDATFSSSGDSLHDFSDTTDSWDRNTLRFTGRKGDRLTVILEWNSWNSPPLIQDLDLEVSYCKYKSTVAEAKASQYGSTRAVSPMEIAQFKLPASGSYCLQVISRTESLYQTSSEGFSFHLNIISEGTIRNLESHDSCGSVRGVATNPNPKVITVGAWAGPEGKVRPYSSRGPTESGAAVPDIYAPDGVTGTNYDQFYGTSAAAPYVAGAYALVRQARPELTTSQILDMLQGSRLAATGGCGNPVYNLKLQLEPKK